MPSHQIAGDSRGNLGRPYLNRCDRCGAKAINLITLLATASQLFLCQHHTNEHESVLVGKALIEPLVPIDTYTGNY